MRCCVAANCGFDSYSDNRRFHTANFDSMSSSSAAAAHFEMDLGSLGSESPVVEWFDFPAPAPVASGIVMVPVLLFAAPLLLEYLLVVFLDGLLAQIPADSQR